MKRSVADLYFGEKKLKTIKWYDLYDTENYSVKAVLINSFKCHELEDLMGKAGYTDFNNFIDAIDQVIRVKRRW